eukprot:7324581-Alexandrium_andersonii.AAC.1
MCAVCFRTVACASALSMRGCALAKGTCAHSLQNCVGSTRGDPSPMQFEQRWPEASASEV